MVLVASQSSFGFDVIGMKPITFFMTGTDIGVGKTAPTR
jgi:hypothetical protein